MKLKKHLGWWIGGLAAFAVLTQLWIMAENRVTTVPDMLIRFFSYFTILTNCMVAVFYLGKNTGKEGLLSETPSRLTAITLYILVVGLVYQVALRPIWEPQGLQMVVDELLHSVVPLSVGIYWFIFIGKIQNPYSAVTRWLIYPACYLIYTLIRGYFLGFYPYPFVNVAELGLEKVLINSFVILLLFIVLGVALITIANRKNPVPITSPH